MLQQALQKIQSELAEKVKSKYVQHVGAFLITHVRSHPEHAPFILTDGKTISGSLSAIEEEARNSQSEGVGVLTDEEGFAVVLKYYGVPVQEQKPAGVVPEFKVSLEELL